MAVILVSRHSGALTWLQRQLGVTDFQQVAHLHDLPMGPGDRVYGILPIAWAARICRAGAEAHILTLDVPPQLRGQELTATQMDHLGARLVCTSILYVLTEAEITLAKFARQLEAAGKSTVKAVLLKDGFETAWFENGQGRIPGA